MPIDTSDVALVIAEVHPGRRAAVDRDHTQLDAGILRAGEGIAMLLDLERWLGLVHDRKDRNVRLVDLLECHHVPAGRRPVAAQAIELLLGDELCQAVGHAGRVRGQPPFPCLIDRPDITVANEEAAMAVIGDLGVDDAPAGELRDRPLGPAVQLAAEWQQHDVRFLGPEVVGDARLAQTQPLAPEHLFAGDVLLGDRLAGRRQPPLPLSGCQLEAPEIADEVASLADQVGDEFRVRRVSDLAGDRHPGPRVARDELGGELTTLSCFHRAQR